MKRQVFIASAVVLCSIAMGAVDGMAQQIFNQFRQPTLEVGRPYRDLDVCPVSRLNKNVLPPTAFVLPPTNINDVDDGYAFVAFPATFRFNYNGQEQTGIWVSVNGFATFDNTKLVPAKQSVGLFTNSASYPDNVVAPFWGDHRYRMPIDVAGGYMPSEISWAFDVDRDENCDTIKPVRRCLIIQWKNLNINDQSINSSVGNFQARLYEAPSDDNYQGDIEFAYGQVGGNPYTSNTTVVTRNATVGIKGNGGFPGFLSDFWNGLVYVPALGANVRTDSTSIWQPSGGRSDAVIRFTAIVRFTFDMWGYGDADTSAARNQRHENLPQNRRVTANDARVIMRSIATGRLLDSVWKRQAYQGDVNHSGRFYFTKLNRAFTADSINPLLNPTPPHIVIWRRTIDVEQYFPGQVVLPTTGKQVLRVMFEGDGLYGVNGRAPDVSNLSQIYYEVTEYDAALIMRYISGRLPYLPWIYDNDTVGPHFGKVGDMNTATDVTFGAATPVGNGLVRIPVFVNGAVSDAFGVKFNTNSPIEALTPVNSENGKVSVDNGDNVAIVIGNGSFEQGKPVAYVTVKEQASYAFSGIRFNEQQRADQALNNGSAQTDNMLSAYPNPMSTSTSFAINLPVNGTYTVRVFDTFGKLVSTIFDGAATAGTLSVTWDGSNVAAGAYIVRVDGEGVQASHMVTVVR